MHCRSSKNGCHDHVALRWRKDCLAPPKGKIILDFPEVRLEEKRLLKVPPRLAAIHARRGNERRQRVKPDHPCGQSA